MGARQLTQSSPRGARRGREKRGAASLHTLKLSAATQRSLRRYCAGDGAQSCVDRLQRMSRLDFGRRALWSSQKRSPPRQRTPRACARRGRAEYEGSSLRRADDSAAPAESVKNTEAAHRGPPIRCRSPRPFRRHQLTALRADAQCRLFFGRGFRSSRIDRDEQDARAAAGLGRRRHEPQGGTIRWAQTEHGQRLSSAEALTVLLLHVEQGWAPGSSPPSSRCHLLEEQ